ncbi:MAG: hypothetical protein NC202_13075, partial [Roseburia sp.]|nr:hypothetical protein [Roseburia sp.]
IGLKVAGKGSYYDGNWQNLIGGVYIDTMTTGSANSLNVDSMGILRLLPAKVGTIGGVSPGLGLRRSSASSSDNVGAITVNVGKGLSLTKKSSYNSTYDSGYEITPKLGEGLEFGADGEIKAIGTGGGGGGAAGQDIIVQGYHAYSLEYLVAGARSINIAWGNNFEYYPGFVPYFKTETEMTGDFYKTSNDVHYVKFDVTYSNSRATVNAYDEAGNITTYKETTCYGEYGITILYRSLMPPGMNLHGRRYENGFIMGAISLYYNYNADIAASTGIGSILTPIIKGGLIIPFASLDEYNAAIGKEVE